MRLAEGHACSASPREISGEARSQGRDEPLIRPDRRSRFTGFGDFPRQKVTDQLPEGNITLLRDVPCRADHFGMQFEVNIFHRHGMN